jgi:broad specificity phosphatase PhoE
MTSPSQAVARPRVFLIRHGETEWNAAGRLLSRTDAPLNDTGEAQAAALAAELGDLRWDRAFSSPLVRARRTAEVVLARRPDAPPRNCRPAIVEPGSPSLLLGFNMGAPGVELAR